MSESSYLSQIDGVGDCEFSNMGAVKRFFGIGESLSDCQAYAPYARVDPPNCSRPVNKRNQARVPGLLAELYEEAIPSPGAFRAMKELSKCVVCGIVDWHQPQASTIYQKWYSKMWDQYLRANGVDPVSCNSLPEGDTALSWREVLDDALEEADSVTFDDPIFDDDFLSHDEYDTSFETGNLDMDETPITDPDNVHSATTADNYFRPSDSSLSTGPADTAVDRSNGGSARGGSRSDVSTSSAFASSHTSSRGLLEVYRDAAVQPNTSTAPTVLPAAAAPSGPSQVSSDESRSSSRTTGLFQRTLPRPQSSRSPLQYLSPNIPVSSQRDPSGAGLPVCVCPRLLAERSRITSSTNQNENATASSSDSTPQSNSFQGHTVQLSQPVQQNENDPVRDDLGRIPGTVIDLTENEPQSTIAEQSDHEDETQDDIDADESDASDPETDTESEAGLNVAPSWTDSQPASDDEVTENWELVSQLENEETDSATQPLPDVGHDAVADDVSEAISDDRLLEIDSNSSIQSSDDRFRLESQTRESTSSPEPDPLHQILAQLSRPLSIAAPVLPIGFTLYPQQGPEEQMRTLLSRLPQWVGPRKNKPGWIYGFRRVGHPGLLKIGVTVDAAGPHAHPVDNRLARWARDCGHSLEEVFRYYMPCAADRMEKMIHQHLRPLRRKERCMQCRNQHGRGREHNEWFQVDDAQEEARVRAVVEKWQMFSIERPYDRMGRLDDFWTTKACADREDGHHTMEPWAASMQIIIMLRRAAGVALLEEMMRDIDI